MGFYAQPLSLKPSEEIHIVYVYIKRVQTLFGKKKKKIYQIMFLIERLFFNSSGVTSKQGIVVVTHRSFHPRKQTLEDFSSHRQRRRICFTDIMTVYDSIFSFRS